MSQVYPKAKSALLKGDIQMDVPLTMKMLLLKQGGAFNVTHEYVADVVAGGVEMSGGGYARQGCGGNVTQSGNYAIFTPVSATTFSALPVGNTIVAAVIYYASGGDDSTNRVIAYYDGGTPPNDLPKATTGGDLIVNAHPTDGLLKI